MTKTSKSTLIASLALLAAILLLLGCGNKKRVYFKSPTDGEEIHGALQDGKVRVKVVMEVEGMTVSPAGAPAAESGHHHILIDRGPIPAGEAIPKDAQHLHYGKGENTTEIALEPGTRKLTLQFADGAHMSYGPAMSATVTVKVNALKEEPVLNPSAVTPTTKPAAEGDKPAAEGDKPAAEGDKPTTAPGGEGK